ncbi:MAG TPA: polyphosphate kinase 2 family protein [Vicinamibacteria bacterium]|nr:polyphosphate kinase 2 family protein [Vicinamibacteria bacterium]
MVKDKALEKLRVRPGSRVRLADYPTRLGAARLRKLTGMGPEKARQEAEKALARSRDALADAQELLYASDVYSVLVVLQALDAAGKDGTIRHVMSGVNPQGCQVFSFKKPSDEEIDHNFLWRQMKALPERGRIGIFNRSHYEEVLVVKVHPELLERQRLPPGKRGRKFWAQRYDDINAFERHLARNGTKIVKFFLHVSKEEQKQRFLERLERPEKNWKFSLADAAEREHWDRYRAAYEECLSETSTKWAPWYVIPADQKWLARTLVARILAREIRELKLQWPVVSPQQKKELAEAKRRLERERGEKPRPPRKAEKKPTAAVEPAEPPPTAEVAAGPEA